MINKYYLEYLNVNHNPSVFNYQIRNLKSLEIAQNKKLAITNSLRSNSTSNTDGFYNYGLYILVASNLTASSKDILFSYNFLPTSDSIDTMEDFLDYKNFKLEEKDRVKIYRIKNSIIKNLPNNVDLNDSDLCLKNFLNSMNYCSYSNKQLELYSNSICYLHSKTNFITFDNNSVELNWFEAINKKSIIKKYDLKFLSRFCKHYQLSRNIAERYLKQLSTDDCFSNIDLEVIVSNVNKVFSKAYTANDFFKDIEFIKTLH